MIEIICDACERSFAVDDEIAGGKVPCPSCGDINRVPLEGARASSARSTEAESRVVPRGAPPADDAERDIAVVRPAMFGAHPFKFTGIVLLVVAGLAGAIWGWRAEKAWAAYLALAPALFGAGWMVQWWVATYFWIKITITNKRTIRHEGIIRRHSTEVLHDHVRSVDIRQNFVQRLFNVGYIGIDSAGQDGIEIEIRDIPRPYDIKKTIDRYRTM